MRWLDVIAGSMHMNLSNSWGSEEQGSLASYSPWACKELDMTTTEQQQQHAFITFHFKPNNCHISKLP